VEKERAPDVAHALLGEASKSAVAEGWGGANMHLKFFRATCVVRTDRKNLLPAVGCVLLFDFFL
jgi:hypothetical protein